MFPSHPLLTHTFIARKLAMATRRSRSRSRGPERRERDEDRKRLQDLLAERGIPSLSLIHI